ncbi:MAG: alpha-glucosidase, partial [Clostridia bacterium]|nr:alpha-glucosidase [Clostridia bacterium]
WDLPAQTDGVPFLSVRPEGNAVALSMPLAKEDILMGLGENVGPINRRGRRYQSWNSDEFNHTEDRQSLYASHNLLLVLSSAPFALYLDDPGRVKWDLGFTDADTMMIESENCDFDLYIITAEDGDFAAIDLCRQFRRLTGRSYIPPRWALGYIQSRWGYASEEDVRTVAKRHREKQIPLDGICLDIDYMDGFRDFTVNKEAIPDLKGLCGRVKADGLHLIPIIDAGVKADAGDPVYTEGCEKDCFCRKEDGETFLAAVWPGLSAFPDFLREDVRAWFGEKYVPMLQSGVDGFWNDMNEPALFYSPEGLSEAYGVLGAMKGELKEHDASFKLIGAVNGIKNSMDDYRRFFHTVNGRKIRHDRVHNLYGAMMTKAAAEGMKRFDPDTRKLLFTRSSFIGTHRFSGVWMGDNFSWWSHLALHLRMLPSLNMAGFIYCGADIGGFGADTEEELLLRWLQLGAFTPLMRNHSALHTREQEIYRFARWREMRDAVRVRYALLPFLYSEMMRAILSDGMLFRPLCFDYPRDPYATSVEDQLMLGESCMIAPILAPHARGRYVYLPEDMLMVLFESDTRYTLTRLEKGHRWIDMPGTSFPLFIRRGKAAFLCRAAERSRLVNTDDMTVLGWDHGAEITWYEDDGLTTNVSLETGLRRRSFPRGE